MKRINAPLLKKNYVYLIGQTALRTSSTNSFLATQKASEVLQTLKVPIVQTDLCRLAYNGRAKLTEKQLCAGAVVGKDSCGGDSGGPLMAPLSVNGPPRYFLVGIVSYGPEKCSVFTVPGVYTKVSSYLDWILTNVRE